MASLLELEMTSKSETKVIVPEDNQEKGNLRHCAYCLTSVPSERILLCGQCKRRAYCSKECQKADWSPKGNGGQGHKIWCPLKCGEEDLDWKLEPATGTSVPYWSRGLGLIAKRPLPSKFRIMVDACRPFNHPLVKSLSKEVNRVSFMHNGDTATSFEVGSGTLLSTHVVCVRICRANHNCDPNATYLYDKKRNVGILLAERDIKAGEEICWSYQTLKSLREDLPHDLKGHRSKLKNKFGIVCPPNCLCRDPAFEKLHKQGKELEASLWKNTKRNRLNGDLEGAVQFVKPIMEIHEKMRSGWVEKMRTLHNAFGITTAALKKSTFEIGTEFGRQWYEIAKTILAPDDQEICDYFAWLNELDTLPGVPYLGRFERNSLLTELVLIRTATL